MYVGSYGRGTEIWTSDIDIIVQLPYATYKKLTDPKKEIEAMNSRNIDTNKNLKRLCRMIRAWKGKCNVPMSGILIDTLVYRFINDWEYKDKSYLYYDFMSRDFFKYLKDLDKDQNYWLAPGSQRYVWKTENFQTKAKTAYDNSIAAIEYENNNYSYSSKQKWREIYGTKFPE